MKVAIALLFSLSPALAAAGSTLSERVDKTLSRYAAYGLSGSLTVLAPGQAIYQARGLADDATKWRNDQSTIFLIASNTKNMTAAAILRLQEQGKLHVKDALSKHLPELPASLRGPNGKEATIEDLLRHTSGMPDTNELEPVKGKLYRTPFPYADVVRALRGKKLRFNPGSKFEYSNTGYTLLGAIVRARSGGRFGDYLKKELFAPLALGDTGVGPPAGKEARTAASYEPTGKGRSDYLRAHHIQATHVEDEFAEGNVYSSSQELARWALELASGHVLSAESTRAMFTPGKVKNYGYGWFVGKFRGHRMYSHLGIWLGYRSIVVILPDDGTALAWTGNSALPLHAHEALADDLTAAVLP